MNGFNGEVVLEMNGLDFDKFLPYNQKVLAEWRLVCHQRPKIRYADKLPITGEARLVQPVRASLHDDQK